MAGRYWARVRIPPEEAGGLPYKAYRGLPEGPRTPMPVPDVLLIDQQSEGFYLFGYPSDGEFTGDTWHRDLDEAKGQADYAYGPYLGQWNAIPEDTADPVRYALDRCDED